MNKKILPALLFFGSVLIISGCDEKDNAKTISISQEKTYPSDNFKIAELMSNKNNLSQQERDKDLLSKINFDELTAINMYINTLNGKPIPPEKTLKDIATDFNILNPQSPLLRGNVTSFYDYFYRDLFIMMLQNQGDPKMVGEVRNCLIFGKSKEMKEILEKNQKSLDGIQMGYIKNSCDPDNKVAYQNIGEIKTSGASDNVILSSQEFKDKIINAENSEDLKKGMDSLDLNVDELLIINGMMNSLPSNSTVKDAINLFNMKYPGAPVIRGGVDKNNAYMRDLDLLKKINMVSQNDIDSINVCLDQLSQSTYPYSELKTYPDPKKITLNIKLSKIVQDCNKINNK